VIGQRLSVPKCNAIDECVADETLQSPANNSTSAIVLDVISVNSSVSISHIHIVYYYIIVTFMFIPISIVIDTYYAVY